MSLRESTFSSFLIFDGNRRAHDLCLAVSRGEPISPLPIVLLGEKDSGKTHLLRAVAQRLRASAGHAAIVMLSPQSNPDEISRLAMDPKPIDMARYAVLLIDDLPAFSGNLEMLAQLARLFLENDHPVIFASDIHPDRMSKLPPALLRIVRGGQFVPVEGGEARAALQAVQAGIREEEHETVARLEQRVRELESVGPQGVALAADRRAAAIEELKRNLAEARDEIEHLRGEHALLSVSAREATVLRKKLDEIERERIARATQPAPEAAAQSGELKRNLEEARFDAQKAREEARTMLERAESLLTDLHQGREAYDLAQRERERQREDIRRFQGLAATADTGTPSVPNSDVAPQSASSHAEPAVARAELESAREEIHRVQESLVRARAERDNAKSHLAHVRHELDTALADLERLRRDSAEDTAGHQVRVSELEAALVARQMEIDQLQQLQRAFTDEVRGLQSQVTEGAEVLDRLMQLFGATSSDDASDDPQVANAADGGDDSSEQPRRADFGEGIRLVARRGPSLRHVEEMRGQTTSFFPPHLPPLDDDDADARAQTA